MSPVAPVVLTDPKPCLTSRPSCPSRLVRFDLAVFVKQPDLRPPCVRNRPHRGPSPCIGRHGDGGAVLGAVVGRLLGS